jgi:hypothetical protein
MIKDRAGSQSRRKIFLDAGPWHSLERSASNGYLRRVFKPSRMPVISLGPGIEKSTGRENP